MYSNKWCFLVIIFCSCSKVKYYPDRALEAKTIAIAHRGGANFQYRENTLEGCIAALKTKPGVEVDIQISKDRTIWLSHDPKLNTCVFANTCFAEASDAEISMLDSCGGLAIKYTKLEALFSYISQNCPNKYVVIDLKGWFPCTLGQLDVDGMMRLEAEIVCELAEKYGIAENILIETESLTPLQWAKKKSSRIQTYLTTFGDVERGMLFALKYKLSGISLKANLQDEPTKEMTDLFHKKGLRFMVWNIGSNTDTTKYFNLGCDFVQFDL